MRITKKVIKALAITAILGSIASSAYAANPFGVGGGWVEGEGYFTNASPDRGITARTVKLYPDSHEGYSEYSTTDSKLKRAVAKTVWPGMKHYSRAQLEWLWVREDSGRQWDVGRTEAKTNYGSFDLISKTYWGTEE
ncbi:hypothetical protein C0Q44_07105 [Paenibacillus sp. PCH8]|uniref:hypothetical protein n=1 Tax=Paenibacillus sp. PCH8 TaxID=2066524 RepID=UPI000CFA0D7F|nr:hypothetical protein [Paenibacillus sp. PCH8]PQP84342.1 hypothetical protein C0Q44_07105 [Paenibacillus sp. PCH8]